MVSGHTGNVVPGNRLWVRIPCPPPFKRLKHQHSLVLSFDDNRCYCLAVTRTVTKIGFSMLSPW